MSEIVFKDVQSVTVLLRDGTDLVSIVLSDITAFRDMKYNTNVHIDTQQNCGVEWCKRMLGIEPTIIDTRDTKHSRMIRDGVR